MSTLKLAAGVLLTVLAVAAGAFVGLYWALVGGIVSAVHAFSDSPVPVSHAVWAILRAATFETTGTVAVLVFFIPAMLFFSSYSEGRSTAKLKGRFNKSKAPYGSVR